MATFWHFNFNFTTTFQSDQLTIVMYSVTGNWTNGVMAEWLKPPSVLTKASHVDAENHGSNPRRGTCFYKICLFICYFLLLF